MAKLLQLLYVLPWFMLMSKACVMPPTFGSFNGHLAETLNDCFWDFAQCTHQDELQCCQSRFENCCMIIMNGTTTTTSTTTTTTTTTTGTTTTPTLINCVWSFNRCVQDKFGRGRLDEAVCYQKFDDCKMIVMGMMSMQDNSVDELPAPFMSIEATTRNPPAKRKPSLVQCLWGFFKCSGSKCNENWDACMTAAMGPVNP